MSDGEFPGLRDAASRSRLLRAASAAMSRIAAASGSSATVRRVRSGRAAFITLPTSHQLRWCAMTFGWAAILYWVGLAVMPPYTATGLPRPVFFLLAMAAWLVAGTTETVVRAWPTSRVARILRWLVT